METKHEVHHRAKHETHKHDETCKCGETSSESTHCEKKCCGGKKFFSGFLTGFILTAIVAAGIFSAKLFPAAKKETMKNPITIEQAQTIAETFINENLMPPGGKIIIKGADKENNVSNDFYKITVNTGAGNDIETYITKDGKVFFPESMDLEKIAAEKNTAAQQIPPTPIPNTSPIPTPSETPKQ